VPASFTTSATSSFTSSFGIHGHDVSAKRPTASRSSRTSRGSRKHASVNDRTGPHTAEFSTSATFTASAEEQSTATVDDYWTWSEQEGKYEDGSCESYEGPQHASQN
jgi:hypothetical protein